MGRKRHHNEDSLLCNNELSLFAVADGMGGHLGGERASRMAVEILEREIEKARSEGLLGKPVGELPPGEPHPIRALLRRVLSSKQSSTIRGGSSPVNSAGNARSGLACGI